MAILSAKRPQNFLARVSTHRFSEGQPADSVLLVLNEPNISGQAHLTPQAQMQSMVSACESRSDVFRYAWFTGRVSPDPHFDSQLAASGQLTALGKLYLTFPIGQ